MKKNIHNYIIQQTETGLYIMFVFFLPVILLLSSCKKLLEVDPPKTEVASDKIFITDANASAATMGMFASIPGNIKVEASMLTGLSADEMISYATSTSNITRYATNSLNATNDNNFWSRYYNVIYQANNIIYRLGESDKVSSATKQRLLAEACFARAFCHFYLLNLFGKIPYNETVNPENTGKIVREGPEAIYPKVIKDLKYARENLTDDYYNSSVTITTGNRIRPNKGAARALLARVYLYMADWKNAETESTAVIGNPIYAMNTSLDNVFLALSLNNKEAIWQLSANTPDFTNAAEAYYFFLRAAPASSPIQAAMSSQLYNAFEPGDLRKTKWTGNVTVNNITYPFSAKYKIYSQTAATGEYTVVMRLAEQYLIRAEARAQLNNVPDAVNDINEVRRRTALPLITAAINKTQCLQAVMQERRVELFLEWGQRWFDLKRTGQADAVLAPLKGASWSTNDQLYPIPQADILAGPSLAPQNAGYN